MKQGWEIKKLGEVCEIVNGSTPLRTNKDFWENGNFPWFTIDDIREQGRIITATKQKVTEAALSKLRVLPVNTVLLCCTASVGEYAITKIELTSNQQFNGLIVRDKKNLCPDFLMHYCATLKDKLFELSGKTTIDFIAISKLKTLEIPLPPLAEQQRIVSILDKAFAAIDQAKAHAERNLRNARELFESYLAGVFEQKGEDWEEKTLGEVCEFRNGQAHEQHIDENGKFILVNSKFISSDGEKGKRTNSALSPLFSDDIVFVMSDVPNGKALAKCFIVDKDNTYTLNQRICAIRSRVFDTRFLYYHLNRHKYLLSFNNGENQTNLRKNDILNCPLFLPSLKEQQAIVQKLDTLSAETQKLEAIYQQKIADLEEMKKSILQKAFSGEL
jgi:type I restriction enzyme S subunit